MGVSLPPTFWFAKILFAKTLFWLKRQYFTPPKFLAIRYIILPNCKYTCTWRYSVNLVSRVMNEWMLKFHILPLFYVTYLLPLRLLKTTTSSLLDFMSGWTNTVSLNRMQVWFWIIFIASFIRLIVPSSANTNEKFPSRKCANILRLFNAILVRLFVFNFELSSASYCQNAQFDVYYYVLN